MSTPLLNAITEYIEENLTVFHMPGHRQGKLLNFNNGFSPFEFDLTEVEGLDNLHQPEGVILEAEKLAAQAFGAKRTFFSVNGSSAGVMAAIFNMCNIDEKVVIERNCHRSVLNGVAFAGAKPVFVQSDFDFNSGLVLPANAEKIINAVYENNAAGVVLTRPTYFGMCSDLKKIVDALHLNGKFVIVDEAHGAHMKFHANMPLTALECGADICVQSAHKTLPALGQTAFVHVQGNICDYEKIGQTLSMFQTTSPSYLLLASLDYCREYTENISFETSMAVNNLLNAKLSLLTNQTQFKIIGTDDWLRLVVNTKETGISGYRIERVLRQNYSIQVEMADQHNVVCILTMFDFEKNSVGLCPIDNFINALIDINNSFCLSEFERSCNFDSLEFPGLPKVKYNLCDAIRMPRELIELDEAEGSICGEYLTPYPPGVPIICPGEVIDINAIEYAKKIISLGGKVNGVIENSIWRLK